ncbi:MAG TPA: isoprenylcysteine carboxylmethyltransferase family protein [Anaeromyxobacter sp.]|nr:isoprenylcysteine carboxylmethyltransferase family protein [Anaeromyxobacter sp.]
MKPARALFSGAVVLYFVIALEVLIMISPFAAFFYAAFDPVLLFLTRWPATGWLAGFFLPHMVVPPGPLLLGVRVAGSVLFVGGAIAFLACAGQVYFCKLARRGPALSGAYAWIRHPQYLSLAVTGLGLAILWPRLLTLVLWTVMVGLYLLLARDEERRMLAAFPGQYRPYLERTGRFLPRPLGGLLARIPGPRGDGPRAAAGMALLLAVAVLGALGLRAYTVARLPLWSDGRTTVLAVLPGDGIMLQHRMADVLRLPEIEARLPGNGAVLAYAVPVQYVMQGMIADTEPAWRLYQHHQTMAMIVDWILHPLRHLEGGHATMHHPGGGAPGAGATTRRIIFLRVPSADRAPGSAAALFALDAVRQPLFFADVDLHTLEVLAVRQLGPGTGWGDVPTPMF